MVVKRVFICDLVGNFFFKQKTSYEMRMSDWSSDVCSSDLPSLAGERGGQRESTGWSGRSEAQPSEPRPVYSRCWGEGGRNVDWKRVMSGKSVAVRVNHGGRLVIKITMYT